MFTIGEFSRLCCISARMLRYYDSIGLLHPKEQSEDNGYRLYDYSQLARVTKIQELKRYEFTLDEIKCLLLLDEKGLNKHLEEQLSLIKQKKKHYQEIIKDIETALSHKENQNMSDYHVITMIQKEQNVLFAKKTINICEAEFHKLAKDLKETVKKEGLVQTGPVQISYLDEEFNPEHANIEMQVEVSGTCKNVKTIKEGLYVTVIHSGSMKDIPKAYQAIMTWLSIHTDYNICGPSLERLICDETMCSGEDDLKTAVLFPITKKN
jgi:DNA-binding transcriptional MerR regulator